MNAGTVLVALLLLVSPFALAHQRLLLATVPALPASACVNREIAEQAALADARASARSFCRSQGFGWRSWAIQDTGELACRPCGGDALQCAFPTIAVKCEKKSVLPISLIRP